MLCGARQPDIVWRRAAAQLITPVPAMGDCEVALGSTEFEVVAEALTVGEDSGFGITHGYVIGSLKPQNDGLAIFSNRPEQYLGVKRNDCD
jgi:hypothetical protein